MRASSFSLKLVGAGVIGMSTTRVKHTPGINKGLRLGESGHSLVTVLRQSFEVVCAIV